MTLPLLISSFILCLLLLKLFEVFVMPFVYKFVSWMKNYKIQIINKIEVEEDNNQKV